MAEPIRSMTGFGAASFDGDGLSVRVELRAVNHRYLQVKIRLPAEFSTLEPELEALIKKGLRRGSVSLSLRTVQAPGASTAVLDESVARAYHVSLARLASELGLSDEIRLSDLIGLPGVVAEQSSDDLQEARTEALRTATAEALEHLIEMRVIEGRALVRDLAQQADALLEALTRVEARIPEVVRTQLANLRTRVEELLDGRQIVAEAELARELALISDRVDVSEEVARVKSHVDQIRTLLDKGGEIGRRMDFLVQEMFREVNTIGSKSSDILISHEVVEMKTRLERLREQVQNVE